MGQIELIYVHKVLAITHPFVDQFPWTFAWNISRLLSIDNAWEFQGITIMLIFIFWFLAAKWANQKCGPSVIWCFGNLRRRNPSSLRERSQMTSSSLGWGGLEKMTHDDGGGGCWAKDDVTFLTWFQGKISNNLIWKSWFYHK